MSGTAGIGHFVSWDGGCLLIGSAVGLTPRHAHYAIQIAFGSEPGIRFRTNEQAEWTEYGGAIIPSRQPHSMDATRVSSNVVIFVEPETSEGRALTELYLRDGIAHLPDALLADAASALFAIWRARSSAHAVREAGRNVVRSLTGGVEARVVSDKRILRAVAYVNSHLDGSLTLDEIAAEAFLSPSRFRHLFVEQTGMALRPYILWRRFLRVWELLMKGESLSSAAHAAGFADAAHLTRTSRRMFGFPPSALQMLAPLPEVDARVLPSPPELARSAQRAGS
jgi:AraC-like DNA-binding protein